MTTTARIEHTGNAALTTITAGIGPTDLTISIADATGWPTGATGVFYAVINDGEATVEKVKITSRSGTTLTVANTGDRGEDGTSAQSHANGSAIHHCFTGLEADQANAHTSAASGVHGVTGSVVGTNDTQTLSNKTLTTPVITSPNLDGTTDNSGATISGGTVSGADITGGTIGPTTVDDLLTFSGSGALRGAIIEAAGTGASDHALTVRERSGGAGKLIRLLNSSAVEIGYIDDLGQVWLASGAVKIGDLGDATALRVVAQEAGDAVIVGRGTTSQTGDLLRIETSAAAPRLLVQASASTRIDPASTSATALLIRLLASQTGVAFAVQDSGANNLLTVDATGNIVAANLPATSTSFTPGLSATVTPPTLGSGSSAVGRWGRLGPLGVLATGRIAFGTSGTAAGSGLYIITGLPVALGANPPQQLGVVRLEDSSSGTVVDATGAMAASGTQIDRITYGGGVGGIASSSANTNVGAAAPWAWGASDVLDFTVFYLTA